MAASAGFNLNVMHVGSGSSSGGVRKRPRELPADAKENARNLFDRMSATEDEVKRVFMESLIHEGGDGGIPFDPDETQSQDGRTPFMGEHDGMVYSFGEDMDGPVMEDQLGLGNSFPLDHEFSKDYGLDEEDDEVDINSEPLFDELPTQENAKKNRKSKWTKAYTQNEDKLLCECWRDIG
ncbi:DNA repair protein rhp54 [Hordeum vulgare]|nr:DNA repair protein rhp54 [Hordeum vulgare]